MKYRVKKIEWEDHTWFYPQRKGRFFWKYYYKDNAVSYEYAQKIMFKFEREAWEYIKNHKDWPVTTYSYETESTPHQ